MEVVEVTVVLSVLCVIGFVYWAFDRRRNKKLQIAQELLKDTISLDGNTLSVEKQSQYFRMMFTVKRHYAKAIKYNEEKIHIGSASVGGVTTGGVYKTGGDYSVKDLSSDRYELIFRKPLNLNVCDETPIKTIRLSDQLVKKAQGTPVEKYIRNYNKIEVVWDVKGSKAVSDLARMGMTAQAVSLLSAEQAEGYPTLEKCNAIIDFLCAE